ncbi:branched-chain-amino-acid transaminase [Oryzomicrobium terrae]|nr:branched-chain-amino-acid transaminase [Oryzomicrobium terrae]
MKRTIWLSGALVDSQSAMIGALSPAAQFGLSVFEGIRAYRSEKTGALNVFRLNEHLERLFDSCSLVGFCSPYNMSELESIIKMVVRANDYRSDIAIRVAVFVDGEGSWTSSEPINLFVAPIEKCRSDILQLKALKACVSSWVRIGDNSLPPRVKLGANYINSRYAYNQAKAFGCDLPIFLASDGKLSESTGACIFLIKDGRLITPLCTSSILNSITRETVIVLGGEMGLLVEERVVDRTELYLADEIFLCGTAAELTPVGQVDQFKIGDGSPGKITLALLKQYHAAVSGELEQHASWLTPI